jgi:hypothetical protein
MLAFIGNNRTNAAIVHRVAIRIANPLQRAPESSVDPGYKNDHAKSEEYFPSRRGRDASCAQPRTRKTRHRGCADRTRCTTHTSFTP